MIFHLYTFVFEESTKWEEIFLGSFTSVKRLFINSFHCSWSRDHLGFIKGKSCSDQVVYNSEMRVTIEKSRNIIEVQSNNSMSKYYFFVDKWTRDFVI